MNFIDPFGLDSLPTKTLPNVTVTANSQSSNNNNFLNSWWVRGSVWGGGALAAPLPKRWIGAFVARNSSEATSILSYTLGKWKKPINFMGNRRLYTHTLNGSKRYASTWGKYMGRWGTKILGQLAIYYTIYDAIQTDVKIMNRTIDTAPLESKNGSAITKEDMIRSYSLGF